ncbi:MAG: hypothetical protein AAFU85_23995 [Planctomycetota bacterium]
MWRFAAIALLAGLAGIRFVGLQRAEVPDRSWSRSSLLATIETGEVEAERFVFSSGAEVLLSVGDDGQPGRARNDDNLNGVLDDLSEIGAVWSDDRCYAPSDKGYAAADRHPSSVVVSRGAFVPVDAELTGDAETRYWAQGRGWFIP